MPGPEHSDPFACITLSRRPKHIRHPIGNAQMLLFLADRRQPADAAGIGTGPSPRRVDHSVRLQYLRSAAVLVADLEGRSFAARSFDLVEARSRHRRHPNT